MWSDDDHHDKPWAGAGEALARAQDRFMDSWPRKCRCGSTEQRTESHHVEAAGHTRTHDTWVCATCGRNKGPAIQSPEVAEREHRRRDGK